MAGGFAWLWTGFGLGAGVGASVGAGVGTGVGGSIGADRLGGLLTVSTSSTTCIAGGKQNAAGFLGLISSDARAAGLAKLHVNCYHSLRGGQFLRQPAVKRSAIPINLKHGLT